MNPLEAIIKALFPGQYPNESQAAGQQVKHSLFPNAYPQPTAPGLIDAKPQATNLPNPPKPSPQEMATQISQQQSQQGGFKYEMGKSDYSKLKPQIEAVLKGTPLEPYANEFIQAANKHKIDPRVLITIANNESSMGKNYPQDSHNPFGYLVNPTTGHGVEDVHAGLRNAGFTSMPHAIDRLTGRFERQPTQNYQQFYQDPTIENLQAAYNANPNERENYLKNAKALAQKFK